MDATWAELLDAVRAEDPADDTATLVAADWLAERGDPRGEFIALACRDERLSPNDPQRAPLLARLRRIDGSPWIKPLVTLGLPDPVFERGFVRVAQLEGKAIANVGKLLRREPITRLLLTSGARRPSEVAAAAPELAYLRSLGLIGQTRKGFERILVSPHLANLDDLHVRMTPQMAGVLGQIAARPRTLSMELEDHHFGTLPRGFFARTIAVDLGGRHLTDEGIARLAGAPLERLSLTGARLTGSGLAALGPQLGALKRLELTRCKLDRSVVDVLANAGMTELEELSLEATYDAGIVDALLEAGIADRVESLDLRDASYSRSALLAVLGRNTRLCPGDPRPLYDLSNDELCDRCPGLQLTPDDDED